MNLDVLRSHFDQIGAELKVTVHDATSMDNRSWRRRRHNLKSAETRYVLDVVDNGRTREHFTLNIWPSKVDRLEFVTADLNPNWQHLLLLVKRFDARQVEVSKDKFLCGHDKRHWFIAIVPDKRGITNVSDAMEALKPPNVVTSQLLHSVRSKNWHKRRNAGFIRQGEWFFIPEPDFQPTDEGLILRQEPIRRPFGKAHIVEEIYRVGGELAYVNRQYPAGLSEQQYQQLLKRQPTAKGWHWQLMRRNPQVFARGKVRHPDHKTIVLPFWYRVMMATESGTAAGGRPATVAFLD